jgi:ParB family chromosome partitioning protein
MLMDGRIDMGHARALLPLKAADQTDAAHEIARRGLSTREAEKLAARMLAPPAEPRQKDRDVVRLEEELAERFATTVQVSANRKGAGRVIFYFDDLEQLDGLLARMA